MRRVFLLIFVVGCGQGGGGGGSFGTSSSGPTTGTTTATTSGTSPGTTGSTAATSSGTGAKLDVGFSTDGTAGTGPKQGCEKVDFLFIVDNSGSMRDEQDLLVAAFPGFIDAINANVMGTDHHIMVIDSDENPAWLCEEFLDGAHCGGTNQQPDCTNYPCGTIDMLGPCASTLGAGVTAPYGGYASNMDCGFPAGRRYLTSADADLQSTFACAARVGVSGNGDEYPLTASVAAVGAALGAAGACNEGFLRDDAILVITLLSDDPASMFAPNDDASAGDPQVWYDGLVAAKNGNANAINVIGIIPWGDVSCIFEGMETQRFVDLVNLFGDNGVLGSVCEDSYIDTFAGAVSVIDTTCDDFTPEG